MEYIEFNMVRIAYLNWVGELRGLQWRLGNGKNHFPSHTDNLPVEEDEWYISTKGRACADTVSRANGDRTYWSEAKITVNEKGVAALKEAAEKALEIENAEVSVDFEKGSMEIEVCRRGMPKWRISVEDSCTWDGPARGPLRLYIVEGKLVHKSHDGVGMIADLFPEGQTVSNNDTSHKGWQKIL